MPKRYRIEMTLFSGDSQLEPPDSHTENYESDEEAKEKFGEKKKAARESGKGRPA